MTLIHCTLFLCQKVVHALKDHTKGDLPSKNKNSLWVELLLTAGCQQLKCDGQHRHQHNR